MAENIVFINFAEGVNRVMNNAKLYVKLLTKFRDGTNLDDIVAAFAEGNMEKAQTAVHTLKGLAANLALAELYKQSLELETQIKAKSMNQKQLEILKNTFDQTVVEVEKVIAQNG